MSAWLNTDGALSRIVSDDNQSHLGLFCGIGMCARLRLDYFFGDAHREVALACMKEAVRHYGEEGLLRHWLNHPFLDNPRCMQIGSDILENWSEVVPGAPTLAGARGLSAISAFLSKRLTQLQVSSR